MPDVYGVFKYVIDSRRQGYSYLSFTHQVGWWLHVLMRCLWSLKCSQPPTMLHWISGWGAGAIHLSS